MPSLPSNWRLVLGLFVGLVAVACGEPLGDLGQVTPEPTPRAPKATDASGSLSPLLERVPADVSWVLASQSLGTLSDGSLEILDVLAEHPQLVGELRRIQAQWEGRMGVWPLDAAGRHALGLSEDAKVALYRRLPPGGGNGRSSLGVLVSGVRPQEWAERVIAALRRRGQGPIGPVEVVSRGGRSWLRVGAQWVCGYQQGYTRCAQEDPQRFIDASLRPQESLRHGPLRQMADSDLMGDLGVYVAAPRGVWPGWAQRLVGPRPRGVFAALSLAPHLGIRILGLGMRLPPLWQRQSPGTPPAAPTAARMSLGLGVARGSGLVTRLRLDPHGAFALMKESGGWGKASAGLVTSEIPEVPSGFASSWTGELMLVSWSWGLGAVLGLGDPASASRFLAALDLRLAVRLPGWQRKVRALGPGWDLTLSRHAGEETTRRELVLQVPQGQGRFLRGLREGRLRLLWGISDGRLLLASDRRVFRRIQTRVSEGDAPFLSEPSSARRDLAFSADSVLAASLRPDDPLAILGSAQIQAILEALANASPWERSLFLRLRAAFDLVHEITLSLSSHPAGVLLHATIGLFGPLGNRIDPAYREALRRKWGGNSAGHLEALQTLAQAESPSWTRDKARRNLPLVDATQQSGLLGLVASTLVPWRAREHRRAMRDEPRRVLVDLGERLRHVAAQASGGSPHLASRWHRSLRTTPLTPARRCCASPDRQCVSAATDWQHGTWKRLDFALLGPHRFQYEMIVQDSEVKTAIRFRAVGDLDCSGKLSILELPASVQGSTGELILGPLRWKGPKAKPGR